MATHSSILPRESRGQRILVGCCLWVSQSRTRLKRLSSSSSSRDLFFRIIINITRWSTLKTIDYIVCSQRWRRSIQSAKTRPGADCGSDHEFLIAKFRLKLKKVEKNTRPFRYDLNQIPFDYTVEVKNRFKGLDLIDRVPDELWMEVRDTVQETGIKTIPKKNKCKKAKWLSEEALQIAVKRREVKIKEEKERYSYLNAEFQRIARRGKKAFLSDPCKEIEGTNTMGKTRHLFREN